MVNVFDNISLLIKLSVIKSESAPKSKLCNEKSSTNMREKLASRLGFILLSAGCAIGLGNVWRFPYIAGQNGGGWFVAIFLVFLVLVGLPVLMMEFATGRAARKSIARLHETLTPEKSGGGCLVMPACSAMSC